MRKSLCLALVFGLFACSFVSEVLSGEINLAMGKMASQSSTGYGGEPQRAVDGNTDGNYWANSVSHTNNAPQEWWQVDLGGVRDIGRIRVWNRTDCCAERLSKFYIFVSDEPFVTTGLRDILNTPGVWHAYVEKLETRNREIPVKKSGRYVRIQLAAADYLSLAEVEVLGSETSFKPKKKSANFAEGKKASQSSTGYGGDPQRAVDGKPDGNYWANSVSHTNNSPQEWWQVDLGGIKKIGKVRLWNRTDCCGERLSNFYVLVSDNPFPQGNLKAVLDDTDVQKFHHPGTAGTSVDVDVDSYGRYVRIQLAGADYLSLAEVEVLGPQKHH